MYFISLPGEVEFGGSAVNQSLVSKMGTTGLEHGQGNSVV